jgi:hypothetical protein
MFRLLLVSAALIVPVGVIFQLLCLFGSCGPFGSCDVSAIIVVLSAIIVVLSAVIVVLSAVIVVVSAVIVVVSAVIVVVSAAAINPPGAAWLLRWLYIGDCSIVDTRCGTR